MKCFRKSTRWFADAVAAAALCLAAAPAANAAALTDHCVPGVSQAIVAALKVRMSGTVEFRLTGMSCALDASGDEVLIATPVPGARVGRSIRFALARRAAGSAAHNVRVGEAFATVTATGSVVRTTRDIPRASIVVAPDVEQAEMSLDDQPLRPILTMPDVVGGRVTRPLRAGQIVDAASIAPVPTVKAGDQVRAVMRMAAVEVETVAIAADNGAVNQVIKVVNPTTRRALRARVVGKGEVEVIDGR
jgi:flagella basal body P-ring formation protein FlgA